jgi:hypothetical protein
LLRGVLDQQVLQRAQALVAGELNRLDAVDPHGVSLSEPFPARAGQSIYKVVDSLGKSELRLVTRQPALCGLFRTIFGEEAKPLDYTWPRIAGPGRCELPHADWVYMCRGTPRLLTAWIPLMDVPMTRGPLMVLENSHRENRHTRDYLSRDADKLGFLDALRIRNGALVHGGRFSRRPDRLTRQFGSRWLSTDYRLGDVIIFSPRGLHATLDNRSHGFRLSIDVRFQPAAEPTDARFEGAVPEAHANRDLNVFHALSVLKTALWDRLPTRWPRRRPRISGRPGVETGVAD